MNFLRSRCFAEQFAEGLVAEHLGELGENLQMMFVGLLRNQQHKQQTNRLAIGRIELHGLGESDESAHCFLQALDSPVRNGDPLAEPGRAEPFACQQAIEDQAARDPLVVFEHQSRLLENALLAARLEVDCDVGLWQQFRDEIHLDVSRAAHDSRAA